MAAPVTPAESGGDDETAAGTDAAGRSKSTAPASLPQVSGGSRTVDLLIELQGKKRAGLEFEGSDSAAARADVPRPRPNLGAVGVANPVGTVAGNPPGLFGAAAAPVPTAQPGGAGSQGGEWRGGQAGAQAPYAAPGGAAAPQAARRVLADDGSDNVIRTVIRWLRDNRGMVVGGALLLLLAMWGTSVKLSQRRR